MSRAKLRTGLAAALVLTLGAAWYAPAEEAPEAAVSAPAAPRSAASRPAAPAAEVDVLVIRSREEEDGESDAVLFAPAEWTPSAAPAPNAAPVAAPVPEPAPQLPPLPFRVLGSHEQGGKTTVFLQQNERNHVVRVGDVIDETYKVESIDGAAMKLRHLPLDQVQTLELGRMLKEM